MDLGGIGIAVPASRTAGRLPAGVDGPSPEYCDTIDATVALLESYREQTAPLDGLAPAHAARQLDAAVGDLWRDWRALWSEATDCLADIANDREHVVSAKKYTEARLTRLLLEAPLWRQAYTKPRGYPGDHLVMNYIYEGCPVGDSAFARLAHMLAIKIGQFVVRRKDFVRAEIASLAAGGRAGIDLRVASLGCGPAREVAEYLSQAQDQASRLCFVLLDQDDEALRLAGRTVAGAIAARRPDAGKVSVAPRKVSVLRLLRDMDPVEVIGQPDLIYSAGLFDYFSDRTCRILTRRLYDALRPGGALLLGNMKLGTDMAWPLEFIADWSLIYRGAERVLGWTEGLTDAEIRLRTESTGYDYMLRVQKPA
jgi:extracellular factor (EF) 3-hydroxypalmitic acid methyl ester biosynthesis protein